MLDINHVDALPELFMLSLNFQEPIGILVGGEKPYTVTGIVESFDDLSVKLEGKWIQLSDVLGVED
ncbi:hypothetical protein [Cohnella yongneupensis]|uniref:Uncharacterized protein n=1 Tax=Cohnella yongneupensis TaxID=425006 RepID=A0ABW0R7F9_9BACL